MQDNVTEFHNACRTILAAPYTHALNYAIGYAETGLSMASPKAVQVQCLYILNNITSWRGENAKSVRETLKRLSKESSWKAVA